MRQRTKTQPGDPKIAVAYIRVSTDDQHLGQEAQRAAIEAWAAREGVQIAQWCTDDGVSGATHLDKRPGFICALAALEKHGAGILVAFKRDRLARDAVIARGLQNAVGRYGARVLTTTEAFIDESDPVGQLMAGILDLFAQFERAQIRSRTKLALQAKRARGEAAGHPPFGWYTDEAGRLVPDVHEQAVIQRIKYLRGQGYTQAAIAEQLKNESYVGRNGKPLAQNRISAILRQQKERSEAGPS